MRISGGYRVDQFAETRWGALIPQSKFFILRSLKSEQPRRFTGTRATVRPLDGVSPFREVSISVPRRHRESPASA